MEPERSGRKENSSRGSRRRLWGHSRYRVNTRIVSAVPQPGSGIGTRFPFARRTGLHSIFKKKKLQVRKEEEN
jgi:hypothetical protein